MKRVLGQYELEYEWTNKSDYYAAARCLLRPFRCPRLVVDESPRT